MKKYYYITGVSGAGKSTLAEEFRKRGLDAIDLDDGFCAWRNIKTNKKANIEEKARRGFYDENDWYCDLKKLNAYLDQQKKTLFVFGASANQDSFLSVFKKIFLLKCSPAVFSERIDSRTNNSYGKLSAEKENELCWFQEFNTQMINSGATIIDAENTIAQVADEILTKLE